MIKAHPIEGKCGAYYITAECRRCSFLATTTTKPVKAGWKKPLTKKEYKQLFTQGK